jgi:hypothetical protein
MSPRCALPEHINDPDEIDNAFPDDSQFSGWFGRIYCWVNKKTKTWFAFSYRCEGWLKWRKSPITLLALGGDGSWRYESYEKSEIVTEMDPDDFLPRAPTFYLSRIQYYKRWHFSIQWPLMITFHFYPKAKDVPVYGEPRPDLDGKLWFAYWGHFDADLVFWLFASAYVGRNWK